MTKINKELLKGTSELMVLSVIVEEPLYGYEIAKRLKQISSDVFTMGEGTLYPILHKLEKNGLLQAFWQEAGGRKRRYYTVTPAGKKMLSEKTTEWQTFAQAMGSVLK